MGRQLTQEEALAACARSHGDTYSYEKFVYTKSTDKMIVTCKLHGDFNTTFSNHTHKCKPRGCPICGDISRYKKKTLPASEFLRKAREVHGDRYDYSEMNYVNTFTKIKINCSIHGPFWQSPEKHSANRGCPICAGRGSMDAIRFIRVSEERHNGRYDYSLITDECFHEPSCKVPIICKEHGEFWQQSDNHMQGQGCRKCAKYGFNVSKPGTLYVFCDGDRVKVGITNRDVSIRLKEINKPNGKFILYYTLYHENGKDCADLETSLLRYMRQNYLNTVGTFDGVTESFEGVDVSLVLAEIERTRRNHGAKETCARSEQ